MLRTLSIRNMILIETLDLDFRAGLNVLTGETGAGKSILLECLGFALGWRGRAEMVRSGADQGSVEAEFDLPHHHPAREVLHDAGIEAEDDTLFIRRVNTAEGRKTAWVNNIRCSGQVLRDLSAHLVELHGQNDDRGLLDAKGHRILLDDFAVLERPLSEVASAWGAWRKAKKAADHARANQAALQEEEDFLRHCVQEFDALDPQEDEDTTLADRRKLMQSAERIRDDIFRASQALGREGAEGQLVDAVRWLESVADQAGAQLEPVVEALSRALSELAEAQAGVEDVLRGTEFDPRELEEVEERLFAIRALARKHQTTPDGLVEVRRDLETRLAALDAGEGDIATLETAERNAKAAYDVLANELSIARKEAAKRLDTAVAAELEPLKMGRAVFETVVTPAEPSATGMDAVAFQVATNPGSPSGALNKIASGGELSRFLLALKVCLAGRSDGLTMIFDEIDRGVGGATADAVGRRLLRLASDGQVLVVTHSPQVAALGNHHWQIAKQQSDSVTSTDVRYVDGDGRIDEIARMLAGDSITDAAREAARALLAG